MIGTVRSLVVLILGSAAIAASCSFLQGGGGETRVPIDIPTSAQVPPDTKVIQGEMRLDEGCLLLLSRDGSERLPIWPAGFNASTGPMFLGLRNGPNDEKLFAAASELLELPGLSVDVAPADARVPAGCEKYPLFHVREAFNRS